MEKVTTTNPRNANLDLLRIVSMLLIILLHSIDHSGVLEHSAVLGGFSLYYVRYLYSLCQVCVNGYVLISGYFLLNSRFSLKKLLYLWAEVAFYAVFIRLVFILTGQRDFSIVSVVSCFVPVITGRYWFITIYVGLYLIAPFLNIAIRAMNKKTHTLLVLALFLLFSVWVSIHPSMAGMNSGGGWGLAWFAVLYITAAWVRLYYRPSGRPWPWLLMFFLLPALVTAVFFAGNERGISLVQTISDNWYRYDSVPAFLASLSLMLCMLNVNIKSARFSRLITAVAPLTLGVYLIHAHADASPWLWVWLDLPAKMGSPLFPLVQIGCVVAIFIVCIAIDYLRRLACRPLADSARLDRFCHTLESRCAKLFQRLDKEE